MSNIEIRGQKRILRKLEKLGQLKHTRARVKAAGIHVKGKIAQYPASTGANSSGGPGSRWYQRGYGPRWMRNDGGLGGSKTSETLGRRWTSSARDGGLTAVIGNNASYAPYVHDHKHQARFHKERGWKSDEQVLDEERDAVLRYIRAGILADMNEV